jgi:hypothetical protein
VVNWIRQCAPAWIAGGLLALIIRLMLLPSLAPLIWPIGSVYELRSVIVNDAAEGTSPTMLVDRTIKRDFRGRFEVQILEREGSEMVVFWDCGAHASAERTYRQGVALPNPLTLDWWMDIPPNRECPLPPGQYRIITTVYAETPFGGEAKVERQSNLFTILPARR